MKALTRLALVCLLAAATAAQAARAVSAINSREARADAPLPSNTVGRSRAELAEAYGKLPMSFEANHGQTDPRVKFISRGSGYHLFLTPDEAVLVLKRAGGRMKKNDDRAVVRMRLEGGNPAPPVVGSDELSGRSNYFVGRDSRDWRTDVPNFARVVYSNVYPEIDLVYYGNQTQLEYDFVVRAGADPHTVTMRFEGADRLKIDEAGDLCISTGAGEIRQRKPLLYQESDGVRREVAGRYVLRGDGRVGFSVGEYDRGRALVIDPVLSYSTFLGGFSNEQGNAIAVDSTGRAFVTGRTDSVNFPTRNPRQSFNAGFSDVFVAVLNPSGTALEYSTYLGGVSVEQGNAIAVDAAGRAYVAGNTSSFDFPATAGAFQTNFGGNNDAFVARLGPAGNVLDFSTFLGGGASDAANGLAVGGDGVYLTGFTFSPNFPTRLPVQAVNRGGGDAFVAKLNLSGGALVYSTYLGGTSRDDGNSIAVDSNDNAYVVGNTTSSTSFPIANAVRPNYGGGTNDGFVTKLNREGMSLVYSTFLGGFSTDIANAVAVGGDGSAYVTGFTSSSNFPTANPLQGPRGSDDAFVAKLAPSGGAFVFSTYLGGREGDSGEGIAVAPDGRAYVTGRTNSLNFPVVGPVQAANRGGGDAFAASFNPTGSALEFSTYLGGSGADSGNDIAVRQGEIYLTGNTTSFDFPVQTPFQPSLRGSSDAFVTKIGENAQSLSLSPASQSIRAGQDGTLTVTLSPAQATASVVTLNSSNAAVASVPASVTIAAGQSSASFNARGNSNGTATVTAGFGTLAATASVNVTSIPPPPDEPVIWLDPASQMVLVNDTGMLTVSISAAQGSDSPVALSSSNSGVASVPPSVTIQAGQTTASFPVGGVSPGSATVTAAFRNSTDASSIIVEARPATGISLSPASQTIQAGQSGTLSVALSAAQDSDTAVSLNSSNPGVASVPSFVTIPAGQASFSFAVSGNAAGQSTISARLPDDLGGAQASASVTVEGAPPPQQQPTISLSPFSQTVRLGGPQGMLTVTISAAQGSDTAVSFTSTNPGVASVPGVVNIPRGATSIAVPLTANAAGSAGFVARLPAALGGSGSKAVVNVIE